MIKRGVEMEAMIGKYKARMKETGLVLIHPVGFSFDLTFNEAVELMEFIDGCQNAIVATQSHEMMDCYARGIKRYRLRLKSPKSRRNTGYVEICTYRNMHNDQRRWRLLHHHD
jgi:hypothetical protein